MQIITGSSDKTIRVHENRNEGIHLATLTGHKGTITCLKFIGDVLISGSEDKSVRVWNISRASLAQCGRPGSALEEAVRNPMASFKDSVRFSKAESSQRDSVAGSQQRESRFSPPRDGSRLSSRLERDSQFSLGRRDWDRNSLQKTFDHSRESASSVASMRRDSNASTSPRRGRGTYRQSELSTQYESPDPVAPSKQTLLESRDSFSETLLKSSLPSQNDSGRSPCLLRVLHGHAGGVRSLDFQGSILYTGDIYGCVRCWHIER